MTDRDDLAQRLRALLAERDDVRAVPMFGGLAFMVDDQMAVCARRDASLLVRVAPAEYDELLQRGAEPALMGDHRTMGTGWVAVPTSLLTTNDDLEAWLTIGIESRTAR